MCYNESVAFISSINQLSKNKGEPKMQYSKEVEDMICVAKGPNHGPAPIPEEGKWIQAKRIEDISGYTHGVGWCAPQQGACKLSAGGDHRLLRHDPFRRDGFRDSAGQDHP